MKNKILKKIMKNKKKKKILLIFYIMLYPSFTDLLADDKKIS